MVPAAAMSPPPRLDTQSDRVLDAAMPTRTCRLPGLVLLMLSLPAVAPAQPAAVAPQAASQAAPAAAAQAPAQAQQVLELLQDDKRRAEFMATLGAIAKAAPAAATAATAAAPAAAPIPLAPDSLGAQLYVQVSGALANAGAQLIASVQAVNDLPLLWRWIAAQATDPAARARMADTGWKLAVILACALLVEWAGRRVLRRMRAALAAWAPPSPDAGVPEPPPPPVESGLEAAEAGETERAGTTRRLSRAVGTLRRLPYLLGRLLLDLAPIGLFALAGELLLGAGLGEPAVTTSVVTAVIEGYVLGRVALAGAALLVSPAKPRLRLLHVSDWAAAFLTRWFRRIVVIGLSGYVVTEVGLQFGMYRTAHDAVLKLFALAGHGCLVVAALQARGPVARRIRAFGAGGRGVRSAWAAILNRLAEVWHLIAIFYIVALWLVWAAELRNGYVRLVHFCLVTVAVMVAARLAGVVLLGGLDRIRVAPAASARHPGLEARAAAYHPIVRGALMAALGFATVFALLEAWGLGPAAWFGYTGLGGRALSAVLLVGTTVLLAVLVWEGANASIEYKLARLTGAGQLARAGRLRTLLPMLRTVLLATIVLVVALMALSELGVNIAPLLAGAGVVGIAVGFGSQKLVQDLITGVFLLLENAMQVGDIVTLASLTGTVEALSIRTIRLRALDGSVHLIPFSAVTTVTNQTRDYGFAMLDISVGLNEAPDPIADLLRDAAAAMQADPAWATAILEPLDVMGVDRFIDTAWIMRVRIKTQPGRRWAVGRELNRRIKQRFDELAIESPLTSHRVLSNNPAPPQFAVAPLAHPPPPQEQAG